MYLKSLTVENIRILGEQTFSFTRPDGSPRMWTVFLGDNGLCKSTLLQVVALAASGLKLTSVLARDARLFCGPYAREERARIDAHFEVPGEGNGSGHRELQVALQVEPGRYDFTTPRDVQGALELDDVRGHRLPGWFVVGYGVGRFLPQPGEVAVPQDPVVDRVEGLFDKRHKVLGTDFYGALAGRSPELAREFQRRIASVLMASHEDSRLFPMIRSTVVAPNGKKTQQEMLKDLGVGLDLGSGRPPDDLRLTSLSDGYQSMLAWIADLLGHAFLESGEQAPGPEELRGIVLLDEIDLHLHPTWQRHVVPVLRQVFPKLQFIVTTHSPLVLAGFEREEIIRLKLDEQAGLVYQDPTPLEPGLLTAAQLLTSFFGVPSAARPELLQKKRRYLELKAMSSLDAEQQRELQELESQLKPYWAPAGSLRP
jgi:hypothetical protein